MERLDCERITDGNTIYQVSTACSPFVQLQEKSIVKHVEEKKWKYGKKSLLDDLEKKNYIVNQKECGNAEKNVSIAIIFRHSSTQVQPRAKKI